MMKHIARTALVAVAFAAAATTASAQQPITQSQVLQITAEATNVFEMPSAPIPVHLTAALAGQGTQEGVASSWYSFATSYGGQVITVALVDEQALPSGLKVYVSFTDGVGIVQALSVPQVVRTIPTPGAADEKQVSYRVEAPLGAVTNGTEIVLVYTMEGAI